MTGAAIRTVLTPTDPGDEESPWWRRGVLYQIYPRSFADSDGDGTGDLPGIIDRLDHLQWLGVDGIWLSPMTVSPNADWGYDVADYLAIEPDLGTLGRLDRLISEAGRRGHPGTDGPGTQPHQRATRVVCRLPNVPRTPPIASGTSGPTPNPTVRPPTTGSRVSADRRGPSTTRQASTTSTTISTSSPISTGGNEEVRDEFDRIFTHWLRPWRRRLPHRRVQHHHQGCAPAGQPPAHGLRPARRPALRAATGLQRQPSRGARRHPALATAGRATYPDVVLLGETPVPAARPWPPTTATGGTSSIWPSTSPSSTRRWRRWPCGPSWRPPRRPCRPGPGRCGPAPTTTWPARRPRRADNDPARTRAALLILLCLRGTPVLYQGDEIGLGDTELATSPTPRPAGGPVLPALCRA